jgi:hypothetical protein
MKLRNVLSQHSNQIGSSPLRNKSQQLKNVLNSKWSRSRDRGSLNSTNNKTSNGVRRSPRLSKNRSRKAEIVKESPIRIGGNGAELLGKIYRRQSNQHMESLKRKQSTGSGIGLNLVHNSSKNLSSRNSDYGRETNQEFNSGLKLYNKKKLSAWNSKKRLNSSNYSKASVNDSQSSAKVDSNYGNYGNLT